MDLDLWVCTSSRLPYLLYLFSVDKEQHQSPQAYDIDVEIESPVRQKMMNCLAAGQTQKEIMGLDEKIVQCVQSINNSKIKRDFLLQFSQEPVDFINKWIASQARDLEVRSTSIGWIHYDIVLILAIGDIGWEQDQLGGDASQRFLQTTLDQGSCVPLSHCQGKSDVLDDVKREYMADCVIF